MLKFILKRILWMIPVILGVLLIVFTISFFTPGDPVAAILGSNYTEETAAIKRAELGLDKPFVVQYVNYVWGIITRFDLGTSYNYGHDVGKEILARTGATLKLGLLGVFFTALLGIAAGLISATKQYSVFDYVATVLAMFFAAMPNFWLALMSLMIFCVKLKWLPTSGLGTWKHWILPVACIALTSVAVVTRMTRSSMLEVIRQDYIRTARAKGLKEGTVIRKHVLRNSIIPVITVVGMQMSMVMGGSVIVETIFSITGLGSYLLGAINNRDYPVINACVLVISVCICVMNLLVDLAYAYIDPRIKAQYESANQKKRILSKKADTKSEQVKA